MAAFLKRLLSVCAGEPVNYWQSSSAPTKSEVEHKLSPSSIGTPSSPIAVRVHTIPDGKYVYWDHTRSLDQAVFNQHRALCDDSFTICDVDSLEIQKQLAFLQWCAAVPEITRMVLDGVVRPPIVALSFLRQLGPENCKARFNCDPFQVFPKSRLNTLHPDLFFLYHYLCGLSRKKNYSVENTPKTISANYTKTRLAEVYRELQNEGFLVATKKDSWQHSNDPAACELRVLMNEANTQAEFFHAVESWTRRAITNINEAKSLDMVLFAFAAKDRETCPCPICSKLPSDAHFLNPEQFPVKPFHFCCGSIGGLPRSLTREFAVQNFGAKEEDYSRINFP